MSIYMCVRLIWTTIALNIHDLQISRVSHHCNYRYLPYFPITYKNTVCATLCTNQIEILLMVCLYTAS